MTRRLEDSGVQFAWETTITGWRVVGGRITSASTTRGDFSADEYVVSAGAWSPALLRNLGLRFAGTMEIAGLDERINSRRVWGIIRSMPQYFPDFLPEDFLGIRPWCGLRPCSPDGLPYIGRFSRYANPAVASGHAMMGVSMGPITGKLMAELLLGEQPSLALEPLSPSRYEWQTAPAN